MANHFCAAAKKTKDELKEILLFIYYCKVVVLTVFLLFVGKNCCIEKNEINCFPEVAS